MIPKKIHYCWFGSAPLPKLVRKCMQTWREVMPDYEICLWNEANSPMEHPFVQQAYAAEKYAFVADYVRFWALYNHGGVYLDTDMYVVRRFDDLLDNSCWFGYEDKEKTYVNSAIIGVEKGNVVMEAILERYYSLQFDPNNLAQFIIPRLVTPIIQDNGETIKLYPYDYFYPLPYDERFVWNWRKYATKNTYAIHLWNISWGNPWAKMRDRINFMRKKLGLKK